MPLTNDQYDSIMLTYSQRRLDNLHLQEERREEAYTRIPELAALENEIQDASLAAAKRRVMGRSFHDDQKSLHQLIGQNKKKKEQLLVQAGYPADYLDPIYTCPICHDTGFVDGKQCPCFKQESTKLLTRESNLEEILKTENFDHFSMALYSKNLRDPLTKKSSYALMAENLDLARTFIRNFESNFSNLFLYGNTGLGKTFLSHCIAKELLDQGHFVVYFSAVNFFDMVSDRHFARDEEADTLYKRALGSDLVILDDVGTEVPNSFSTSALFTFLNNRIETRKPVIISTNLALNQFKDIYGERIFSRIMSCYKFLAFVGEDIREQKRTVSP